MDKIFIITDFRKPKRGEQYLLHNMAIKAMVQ